MQIFYIVSALVVSIGVNTFAGADSQRQISAMAETNRAVAMEQQAQTFARALRREISLNPGQFSALNGSGEMRVPDHIVAQLDFGGYNTQGRYEFHLRNNGQIVASIASGGRNGANGLNARAGIVNGRIQNPGDGRRVGRFNPAHLDD